MHIPKSTTNEINILKFKDCLNLKGDTFNSDDWLYVPPMYTEYRYILGTKGERPLICIGINPSTAQPNDLDNTLKSVDRIAKGNGFDSFMMFNVYAQRATRPADLDPVINKELHKENMAAFEYLLSKSKEPVLWAAWGTVLEVRPYLKECVQDMIEIGNKYNARWVCAGKVSIKGHPHHPLYLKKDEKIKDFDIETYVGNLK